MSKKISRFFGILMVISMILGLPAVAFAHEQIICPTLSFSSDKTGTIADWTVRGDANCDKKITAEDYTSLGAYLAGSIKESGMTTERHLRNGDIDADGLVTLMDHADVKDLIEGTEGFTLPVMGNQFKEKAFTFEVNDTPKLGYKISAVTVNGTAMNLPAKGGSATTEANGVTYTVTIDADGRGSVFGKYLEENEVAFAHEAITYATLSFSSDKNGTIEDWTFRGDPNDDLKVTADDLKLLMDYFNDATEGSDMTTERHLRNGDVDADELVNREDLHNLNDMIKGRAVFTALPVMGEFESIEKAFAFEVNDAPNDGYEIATITVNGEQMNIPAKGQSATTEANGVTYTVTIDANGKGSVSGKYLEENVVAFTHAPIAKIEGTEDPPVDPNLPPTEEAADKKITATDTDGDFAGSTFGLLRARGVSKGKKKILLKWTDPKLGAAKYVVYGNRCNSKGKKYKYKKLKTFDANTFRYVPRDIHGEKLKKGTYYKFVVKAVDKDGKVLAVSKTVHVTTKGKRGNDKAVKRVKPTKKAKYTLNAGKTKKLKVKEVKGKKRVARHRVVSWESSNPNVVVVSKKGKVTAKGAGTCTIYAYAQNGVYTTFKIIVK